VLFEDFVFFLLIFHTNKLVWKSVLGRVDVGFSLIGQVFLWQLLRLIIGLVVLLTFLLLVLTF